MVGLLEMRISHQKAHLTKTSIVSDDLLVFAKSFDNMVSRPSDPKIPPSA